MTTTPIEGVDSDGLSRDETADLLLSRMTDARKPSRDDEGAIPIRRSETERNADTDTNRSEADDDLDFGDEDEQDTTQDEADALVEASDDAVVKVTVDGEELQVAVKDLKRLYGQEAALTRKSQEVAQKRQFAEDEGARYVVATERLLDRAKERFQPYANIDWAIAAKTLENDEYVALRQEAQAAHTDVRFLAEELEGVFTQTQEARQLAIAEEANHAVEVLTRDIPNFNAETYQAMATYAVSQGLPEEAVAQLTDPAALKLIHQAMSYAKAKERAASKRATAPTSKRTMQSNRRPQGRSGDASGEDLARLKQTGSREDAIAVLMARAEAQRRDHD